MALRFGLATCLVGLALTAGCLMTRASAQQDAAHANTNTLGRFLFAAPATWVFIEGHPGNGDDMLFRRYSFVYLDDKLTADLGIPNTIFFACRSDREENHLAIHIPPAIRLNSFADRESRSRLEVRFATDNRQFKIWGEYLDGDINFRAPGDKIAVFNDPEGAFIELREIADVPRLDLEFGREKDSMHFLIGDKLPSGGDVDGAVRKALPEFMKRPSENFHYFSTQAMLAACSKFRKGGGSH